MITRSAERAFKVLALVCASERPMGVTAIAKHFGISSGTVFRALDALESAGYIARYQSSTQYVPGPEVRRLKRAFFGAIPLRDVCMPFMRQLAFVTGETVSLNIAIGWYAVRIAAAAGANNVIGGRKLGHIEIFGETIASKAIFAFREPAELARALSWTKPRNPKALQSHLKAIRADGFALEPVDFVPGKARLAVPIEFRGSIWASILIEGPAVNAGGTGQDPDVRRCIEAVGKIAQVLEGNPDLHRNPYAHLAPEEVYLPSSSLDR